MQNKELSSLEIEWEDVKTNLFLELQTAKDTNPRAEELEK